MATDFFYFIASLPALSLEKPAPYRTYQQFLRHCSGYLSREEMAVLDGLDRCPDGLPERNGLPEILRKWRRFETFVRNSLVELRSRRLKRDRRGDLRECPDFLPGVARRLEAVAAEEDIALRERRLDEIRWEQLDDWAVGHDFDFPAAALYALRLAILVRHHPAPENEGVDVLAAILDRAADEAAAARVDGHTA